MVSKAEVWRALEYPYSREHRDCSICKECSSTFTKLRSGASPNVRGVERKSEKAVVRVPCKILGAFLCSHVNSKVLLKR